MEDKAETTEKPVDDLIEFTDFTKIKFKVAQIIEAEKIEKSEKLIKLQVSLGEEQRQIVAGIAKHYSAEELVGRKVIVVANLKPAKLMGELSQGMLLAAGGDTDSLEVLSVGGEIPVGARVS